MRRSSSREGLKPASGFDFRRAILFTSLSVSRTENPLLMISLQATFCSSGVSNPSRARACPLVIDSSAREALISSGSLRSDLPRLDDSSNNSKTEDSARHSKPVDKIIPAGETVTEKTEAVPAAVSKTESAAIIPTRVSPDTEPAGIKETPAKPVQVKDKPEPADNPAEDKKDVTEPANQPAAETSNLSDQKPSATDDTLESKAATKPKTPRKKASRKKTAKKTADKKTADKKTASKAKTQDESEGAAPSTTADTEPAAKASETRPAEDKH